MGERAGAADRGLASRGGAGPRFAPLGRWWAAVALLALAVVVLGATVRLKDAGLGCPDWPGCYGRLTVAAAQAAPVQLREARWPESPLHPGRAHLEMAHRYAAGTLGLLVLGFAVAAWRRGHRRALAAALVGLVVFQALLGMWTVTLRLEPLVVTAHLLGGMAVLGGLWWMALGWEPEDAQAKRLALRHRVGLGPDRSCDLGPRPPANRAMGRLRGLTLAGLGLLVVQIALGGWTAANSAALACQGFPTCNGAWWPAADFVAGFAPWTREALDGAPTGPGLIAVHWAHRLGALILLPVLLALAILTVASQKGSVSCLADDRQKGTDSFVAGLAVGVLVLVQAGLGIANVLTGLPLVLAVAHNAVAALLLLAVLTLLHGLHPLRLRGRASAGSPVAVSAR